MRRAPLLCMDVEIAAGNTARIEYYDGDDTAELAAEFCLIHDLDASLVCPRCKIATPPKAPAGGLWHLGDGDGGRLWHLGVWWRRQQRTASHRLLLSAGGWRTASDCLGGLVAAAEGTAKPFVLAAILVTSNMSVMVTSHGRLYIFGSNLSIGAYQLLQYWAQCASYHD